MEQKIIYWVIIAFFTVGCNSYDPTLMINNQSQDDIYIEFSCDSFLTEVGVFREKYWFDKSLNDSVFVTSDEIFRSDSAAYFKKVRKYEWINFISSCPDSTMYIFIMTDSVVKKFTNDQILNNNMFELRLKLTYQDLKLNNWVVTYTGKNQSKKFY